MMQKTNLKFFNKCRGGKSKDRKLKIRAHEEGKPKKLTNIRKRE